MWLPQRLTATGWLRHQLLAEDFAVRPASTLFDIPQRSGGSNPEFTPRVWQTCWDIRVSQSSATSTATPPTTRRVQRSTGGAGRLGCDRRPCISGRGTDSMTRSTAVALLVALLTPAGYGKWRLRTSRKPPLTCYHFGRADRSRRRDRLVPQRALRLPASCPPSATQRPGRLTPVLAIVFASG